MIVLEQCIIQGTKPVATPTATPAASTTALTAAAARTQTETNTIHSDERHDRQNKTTQATLYKHFNILLRTEKKERNQLCHLLFWGGIQIDPLSNRTAATPAATPAAMPMAKSTKTQAERKLQRLTQAISTHPQITLHWG